MRPDTDVDETVEEEFDEDTQGDETCTGVETGVAGGRNEVKLLAEEEEGRLLRLGDDFFPPEPP